MNKVKIFSLIVISFIGVISLIFLKHNNEKKNIDIADKYVQAGLQLSMNNKENAKIIYEEIILSKNKFYSILSLNTVIENDLIKDNEKVLKYFQLLEDLNYSNENLDLIMFKKALYLIKTSQREEGEKILKLLIKNSSQLKVLAEEVIKN